MCSHPLSLAVSGEYHIAISLHGASLPGSPFAITVSSSRPDPMRCVLKGDALHRAVAREQASFEIAFHDSIGQYTHAEEVDVYVERLEEEDDGRDALEQMSGELEAAENAAAEQLRAQQQQAQGGSPKRRGSNASLIDVSDLSSKASEGGSSDVMWCVIAEIQ